jgi:hypothetical protein
MKTSELTGHALDWAVAMCEGIDHDTAALNIMFGDDNDWFLAPSTDWAQGGPIIERERMDLLAEDAHMWNALMWWDDENSSGDIKMTGPTPLIAAMRCYVASKLGADVDVPELLQGESK